MRRWPDGVKVAGSDCSQLALIPNTPGTPRPETIMPDEKRERYKFPRASRLSRAAEFKLVKQAGRSWTGRHLVLGVLAQADATRVRLGIVTTRKVGIAVVRNRIRRRIREVFRLHQFDLVSGIWLVAIARPSAAKASFRDLERDWLRLAERASILTRS